MLLRAKKPGQKKNLYKGTRKLSEEQGVEVTEPGQVKPVFGAIFPLEACILCC